MPGDKISGDRPGFRVQRSVSRFEGQSEQRIFELRAQNECERKEIIMHSKGLLFFVFLFLVPPLSVLADSDISGWGKTKWGMTHAEVGKLYDLDPWEPGSTPSCKMKKKIKVLGHDFVVAFYFDERSPSGKLYKVVLVRFDPDQTDGSWLNSIKKILVEKYGNPAFFEVENSMKISRWITSEGQLKLTTLEGRTMMCAIEYIAVRSESEKL